MQNKIQIFTEDKELDKKLNTEQLFLQTIIKKYIPQIEVDSISFKGLGGWNKIEQPAVQKMFQETANENGINLIIFDADTKKHENGGEENRRKKLTKILTKEGITNTPIFLFPNNKNEGEFETLLCKLIPENHQQIMKCFTSYKKCVEESPQYEIYEFEKAKPYVYISSCKEKSIRSKFKDNDWSFDNPIYWNLEHEALEPLKKFLTENLISQLTT